MKYITDCGSKASHKQGQTPQGEGAALPCLNSNISIDPLNPFQKLSTQHRKTAFILSATVESLASRFGIHRLGFLTLTFADHILCPKEAQKRLNSLLSNVIKKRYQEYVGVFERQKSGRIHYHLLVVLNQDIRSGVDFDQFALGNYSSASVRLKLEWRFWRETAKKYGFGRTELLPIKSTVEAMAKYVGKYISKHISERLEEDKGVRLVRYSEGARAGTTRFQFHSNGSQEWRRKVGIFAGFVKALHPEEEINDIPDLTRVLGKRWVYKCADFILDIDNSCLTESMIRLRRNGHIRASTPEP